MVIAKKKPTRARRANVGQGPVFYRGVKLVPMTGSRSAIARTIRDGLRKKSEEAHVAAAQG